MEYVIGATLTLITVAVCNILLRKNMSRSIKISINSSQSRVHQLVKPLLLLEDLFMSSMKSEVITQSMKYHNRMHVKVIMSDFEAYWISNNIFYVADVENQMIVQETTREVDTMAMDEVELKKIMDIVDMLGEDNDRGNSGNKEIR
jgi:hypothetical protein